MWNSVFQMDRKRFKYDSLEFGDCELRVEPLEAPSFRYSLYVSGVHEHYEVFVADSLLDAREKAVKLAEAYIHNRVSHWCKIASDFANIS